MDSLSWDKGTTEYAENTGDLGGALGGQWGVRCADHQEETGLEYWGGRLRHHHVVGGPQWWLSRGHGQSRGFSKS